MSSIGYGPSRPAAASQVSFDQRSPSRSPMPDDIISRVALELFKQHDGQTLLSLQRLCQSAYEAVTPILYRHLRINARSGPVLTVRGQVPVDLPAQVEASKKVGSYFASRSSTLRRLDALRHVRAVTVESVPLDLASHPSVPSMFMPRVRSVSFLPPAVTYLRKWSPIALNAQPSRTPPLMEVLAKACKPEALCIAFPLVDSAQWEEHRDASISGQYQLVSLFNRLKQEEWSSLRTLEVHDIVHQVIPSLAGCRNVYHFSNHAVRSKVVPPGPPTFLSGIDAVGVPGLSWNVRAWQVGQAIKNVFPSGVDAKTALEGTSWTFVNVEGQILTKSVRDDDDESGVGWEEAAGLIKGAVRAGLPIDLPARAGFSSEDVTHVFERIAYMDQTSTGPECAACGRESVYPLEGILLNVSGIGQNGVVVDVIEQSFTDKLSQGFAKLLSVPLGPSSFAPMSSYTSYQHR